MEGLKRSAEKFRTRLLRPFARFYAMITKSRLGSKVNRYDLIVVGSVLIYGVVFSYFTVLKHNIFQSYAWDLGTFDQALYTTLHGRFLYYTAELYVNLSGCYFAQHISPLLLLLLPFYAISPSAVTLLVIKSFVLAIAAVPLYLSAQRELGSRKISTILAVLYLMYPALQGANWFDFQPQAFLPLFIFSSYYFLRTRRWMPYFLSTVLALMVEEHISIIIFVLSFFILLRDRKHLFQSFRERELNEARVLAITMILCVVWFIVAIYWKGTFPINQQYIEIYKATNNFSVLGLSGDPLLLPIYILFNPQRVWSALLYDYPIKFFYLTLLFGPLLFMPFRSKLCLGAFLLLAPFLLSNAWLYYTIGAHYPLYILPVIFLAEIDAVKKIHFDARTPLLKTALVVSLIFMVSTSPISPVTASFGLGSGKQSFLWYPALTLVMDRNSESLNKLISLIPRDASVLTQNNIFPHVSNRLDAYVLPVIPSFENDTKYVTDLTGKSDYILLNTAMDQHASLVFDRATANHTYGVYGIGGQCLLFKKGYEGAPLYSDYTYGRFFQASNELRFDAGQVVPDASSRNGNVVVFPKGYEGIGTYGPYVYLTPGTYNVTFRIKADDTPNVPIATLGVSYTHNVWKLIASKGLFGPDLIPNQWVNVTITISLSELTPNVEFLIWVTGATRLSEDGVLVTILSD